MPLGQSFAQNPTIITTIDDLVWKLLLLNFSQYKYEDRELAKCHSYSGCRTGNCVCIGSSYIYFDTYLLQSRRALLNNSYEANNNHNHNVVSEKPVQITSMREGREKRRSENMALEISPTLSVRVEYLRDF